jgi:serine phosphatase RsbU (regulator of sigma subunit)/uncharacterized protein HemY
MKKLIPFVFIVLFFSFCQNTKTRPTHNLKFSFQTDSLLNDTVKISVMVDSLKLQIKTASKDTQAINLLNELAGSWRKYGNVLSNEALRLSKENNYSYGENEALYKMGSYYRRILDYKKADSLFSVAIEKAENKKQYPVVAQILLSQADIKTAQSKYGEAEVLFSEADSLTNLLGNKRCRVAYYAQRSEFYRIQFVHDTAMLVLKKCIELSQQIHDRSREAFCLSSIGDIYYIDFKLDSAALYLKQALKIAEEMRDKNRIAFCCYSLGRVYGAQSDYTNAVQFLNRSLVIAREQDDKSRIAENLKGFCLLYRTQNEFQKAIDYMRSATNIQIEINNQKGLAGCYNNLGEIYNDMKNYDSALVYFNKALAVAEKNGYAKFISENVGSIARLFYIKGEISKAKEYFNKSLAISQKTGHVINTMFCFRGLSEVYASQHNMQKALECAQTSLALAQESEMMFEVNESAQMLYKIYAELNKPDKALKAFLLYSSTKDSLYNESQIKKFESAIYAGKEEGLKAEQFAKEKVFKAEQERKEEEIKRQKTTRNFFIIGFILIGLLAFVIYRSLQQNKKDKAIIQEQKKMVEERQKEMKDSITYAKRLQEAILPSPEMMRNYLPNCFILYIPKDIVAGDFYWFHPIEKNDVLLAVADCTGHGVPGAMVSVVCSNALDRAVKEFGISDPGKILDKVRELVIETFEKSDKNVKDGMDISLVRINTGNEKINIEWAGANNPLWYMANGQMNKIVADKQPIGKFDKEMPFTTHRISLSKNDMLYLFSDGYADQFGGADGKKLKYKPMEEYIKSVGYLAIQEQENELEKKFESWKGGHEQVDDVCIIGIRL